MQWDGCRSVLLFWVGRSDREENDTNTTYLVEYILHDVLGWEGESFTIWDRPTRFGPKTYYCHPFSNQRPGNALPIPPLTK